MREHLVDALADLRELVVLEEVGRPCRRSRRPRLAAVLRAEDARRRDADVEHLGVVPFERDRVAGQAARAGLPAVARGVLEDPADGRPRARAVVRAEEHGGVAAGPERVGLRRMPRLDVPDPLHRLVALGRRERLRPLPRLAAVGRPLDDRAVHVVVRGGQHRAVARVDRRVEDLPARQVRALELPGVTGLVPADEEEALARSD